MVLGWLTERLRLRRGRRGSTRPTRRHGRRRGGTAPPPCCLHRRGAVLKTGGDERPSKFTQNHQSTRRGRDDPAGRGHGPLPRRENRPTWRWAQGGMPFHKPTPCSTRSRCSTGGTSSRGRSSTRPASLAASTWSPGGEPHGPAHASLPGSHADQGGSGGQGPGGRPRPPTAAPGLDAAAGHGRRTERALPDRDRAAPSRLVPM